MDNYFKEIISVVSGQKIEKLKKVSPELYDEILKQLGLYNIELNKAQIELEELRNKADKEGKNKRFSEQSTLINDIKVKENELNMIKGSIDQLTSKLPSSKDEINSVVAEITKKHNIQN